MNVGSFSIPMPGERHSTTQTGDRQCHISFFHSLTHTHTHTHVTLSIPNPLFYQLM
jgi:hypothetical protein